MRELVICCDFSVAVVEPADASEVDTAMSAYRVSLH